jgi:PIF1-like helicase
VGNFSKRAFFRLHLSVNKVDLNFNGHCVLKIFFRHHNSIEIGEDHCLQDLAGLLEEHGKTLSDFGLREPIARTAEVEHELERWSSNREELQVRVDEALTKFTEEQRNIYNDIMSTVLRGEPLLAFIDGKAGRGKTFLLNTMCDQIRAMGNIVLPTATSAFAAQLYAGGRTAHSAFKVCNPLTAFAF